MRSGSPSRIVSVLEPFSAVTLTFHSHPDGDCIASAFLLALGLRALGKRTTVVCPEGLPGTFRFLLERLPETAKIPVLARPRDKERGCLVVLDSSNPERSAWDFQKAGFRTVINVDHHADNSLFGTIHLTDSAAPAVSDLVVRILDKAGVNLSVPMAELLYVSLYSDTAGMTISGERIRALLLRALRGGADVPRLNNLLKRKTLPAFLLQSRVFSRLTRVRPGVYWTWAARKDLAECGAAHEHFDSVTEELSRLQDAEVFFLMKETGPRQWKVSIRSRNLNVRKIAAVFGGGGHDRASGFQISGTPSTCARKIIGLIPGGR